MSNKKVVSIIVAGADGSGRTQIAEIIKNALLDRGFTDLVSIDPVDKLGGLDLLYGKEKSAIEISEKRTG